MLKDFFNREHSAYRKVIISVWLLLILLFVGLPAFIFSVSIDLGGLYGGMPSLRALENPENDLSSEIFSVDGVSLGKYFRYNRSNISYKELSDELITTLISSEDHRFYNHSGIDFWGLLRAIYGTVTFNFAGGGSTLSMQLSENLFKDMTEVDGKLIHTKGLGAIVIKTKEWIIATQLEKNFTKDEILAMYLNTVSFGSHAFGIKAASETFFGKPPSELNYQESAVLIGLLQAVTFYNPVRNYDNSIQKRNEVLRKIKRLGHITTEEYDSIADLPIDLSRYRVTDHNEGLATYFRSVIKNDLMKWCKENNYDLWEDGLKIYTTIDSRMQKYAEEAVDYQMKMLQNKFDEHWKDGNPWIDDKKKEIEGFLESRIKRTPRYKALVSKYGEESDSIDIILNTKTPITVFSWEGKIDTLMSPIDSLNYYKRFLHTGFISVDPHSGSIKAWVGGINHTYFQYDHVRQGKRQPGSTFKPFVYGAAIENGYTPCFELPDVPVTFPVVGDPPTWTPPNSGNKYSEEMMTIRKAMANSVNSITANVMKRIGSQTVVDFAHKVGIESKLEAVPSLCLGTSDVSIFELSAAYSTFANEGIATEPYFITKIEDKNGNVIQNFVPKTKQAISEETAYVMLHMLKGGIEEEGGTSRGLSRELKEDNEIGGKTGTTNNASDGWYMGITKDLVTGVWVGGDERSIHFRNWYEGQGGRTARPIWDYYMRKIYADSILGYEKGPFKKPVNGLRTELDCSRYGVFSSSLDESDSTFVPQPDIDVPEDDVF
ncbi:MAG: transglycosylase domain-containing protein [Cyclobacteriaceae bacterium]|nr:transglycosylase domain-containing protein [Cyclobacteriaceae bacterium]